MRWLLLLPALLATGCLTDEHLRGRQQILAQYPQAQFVAVDLNNDAAADVELVDLNADGQPDPHPVTGEPFVVSGSQGSLQRLSQANDLLGSLAVLLGIIFPSTGVLTTAGYLLLKRKYGARAALAISTLAAESKNASDVIMGVQAYRDKLSAEEKEEMSRLLSEVLPDGAKDLVKRVKLSS